MSRSKPRTAVLMGGVGGEREVSLKSGRAVAAALDRAGYDVIPFEVNQPSLEGLERHRPDAAFVALHGAFGEDGTAQLMLEEMGLPYTGSSPRASRLGMDKLASKRLFIRHAVPTADYLAIGPDQQEDAAAETLADFGYPVVCKPATGGSSLGVGLVRRPEALVNAVREARRHADVVLVERYVHGRELTVGVLDGRALPIIELVVENEFFDYSAKYEDGSTRYLTPVALLPTIYRKATDAALRAWRALGCRHMARVDMLYGYDGTLSVLEVNTIPGFTPRSLLPMAAAQDGIEFPDLCDRIVQAALRDAALARRRRLSA